MTKGRSEGGTLSIAGRRVGAGRPSYVIAELGSNHDGELERAFALVDAAAAAGADAVKFQSFSADTLCRGGEPAFPILEKLALPREWHEALRDRAVAAGVDFLSTPFDCERVGWLDALGVPAFKIASGDLTHLELVRCVARTGRPLLLSTGLADLEEVRSTLAVAREAGASDVALLHCVAAYPPRFEDMNLRAIQTLATEFGTPVGLSDHTPGHAAVLAAVALGACVVEKHVTFDRNLPGPDHGYALTMEELASLVGELRQVEAALGSGCKRPAPSESEGRVQGRRSLHAAQDLPVGTELCAAMLKIVRPAEGLAPCEADGLRGRRLTRELRRDEPLTWAHLS